MLRALTLGKDSLPGTHNPSVSMSSGVRGLVRTDTCWAAVALVCLLSGTVLYSVTLLNTEDQPSVEEPSFGLLVFAHCSLSLQVCW